LKGLFQLLFFPLFLMLAALGFFFNLIKWTVLLGLIGAAIFIAFIFALK